MILDLGCGNWCRGDIGLDVSFEKGGTEGYKPHRLDRTAGKRNLHAQLIEHDLNNDIPFESEAFDEVKAIHFLEHLENPMHVLREAYRVLKPGGKLMWIFPNPLSSFLSDRLDKGHMYSWSPYTARNTLIRVGFVEIRWSLILVPLLDICIKGAK